MCTPSLPNFALTKIECAPARLLTYQADDGPLGALPQRAFVSRNTTRGSWRGSGPCRSPASFGADCSYTKLAATHCAIHNKWGTGPVRRKIKHRNFWTPISVSTVSLIILKCIIALGHLSTAYDPRERYLTPLRLHALCVRTSLVSAIVRNSVSGFRLHRSSQVDEPSLRYETAAFHSE
jgi:hypothetical protein